MRRSLPRHDEPTERLAQDGPVSTDHSFDSFYPFLEWERRRFYVDCVGKAGVKRFPVLLRNLKVNGRMLIQRANEAPKFHRPCCPTSHRTLEVSLEDFSEFRLL